MQSEKPTSMSASVAKLRADLDRGLKALADDPTIKAMREQGRHEEAFLAEHQRVKELFAKAREKAESIMEPRAREELEEILRRHREKSPEARLNITKYDDLAAVLEVMRIMKPAPRELWGSEAMSEEMERLERREHAALWDVQRRYMPPLPPLTVAEFLELIQDPCSYATGDAERDRKSYLEVRHLAGELRDAQPTLPPLPPPAADPWAGLVALWEWASEAAQAQQGVGAGGRATGDRLTVVSLGAAVTWRGHQWSFSTNAAKIVYWLCCRRGRNLPAASVADIQRASETRADRFKVPNAFRERNARAHDGTPTIGAAEADALIVKAGHGLYELNPAIQKIDEPM